jgi:hypothetical protein
MQRVGSGIFFSISLFCLECLPDANIEAGESSIPQAPSPPFPQPGTHPTFSDVGGGC